MPTPQNMQYKCCIIDDNSVTFSAAATQSSILDCGGTPPSALILPSDFSAGNISFNVGIYPDELFLLGNFDGSTYQIAVTSNLWIPLIPSVFHDIHYLQIISSVPQTLAKPLAIVLTPIYQGIHS